MRRAVTAAGVLAVSALVVPLLASPAAAAPQVLYVRNDERGVAAGVHLGGTPVAGASVAYADVTVCVGIGLWTSCTPVLP